MPNYGPDRTSLVLNFDGSLADSGQFAHVATPSAGATISSAQSKFGGESLLLNGTTGVVTIPSHASLQLGTADFTISAWVRPVAVASTQAIICSWGDTGSKLSWWFGVDPQARLAFYYSTSGWSGSFEVLSAAAAVSAGVWQHVAASRSGGVLRLFVNGAVVYSSGFPYNLYTTDGPARIGASEYSGGLSGLFSGHIDGVLLLKGLALHVEAFDPPSSPPSGPNYLVLEPKRTPSVDRVRSSAVPPVALAIREPMQADSGFGRIVGTVKEDKLPVDLPLRRRVRLHDDATGRAVREVWSSAATGAYEFPRLDPSKRYSTIAYDHERNHRAVIADNLTPEPTP